MKKKTFAVSLVVAIMLLLTAGSAWADGGLFGKNGNDIYEPEQKAVIFFHEGTEEMVLSVRFDGAAEEFAWLVPTPAEPEIEESDLLLFEMMSAFTPPDLSKIDESRWGEVLGGTMMNSGIEILNTMTAGPFDLTVVRSDSTADLREWLSERGFTLDSGAGDVLADYVDAGWCFTAMRVNPSYLAQEWSGEEGLLSEGTISPLRFTFPAEEPVFPLTISSVNPGYTEVLLYILAGEPYINHRMILEFEERWQPEQIGTMEAFSVLATEMEKDGGCYLTKLRRSFAPDQMEDLYFTADATDGPAASYESWPGMTALTVGGDGEEGGTSDGADAAFPWWVLLTAAVIIAGVIAVIYGSSDPEKKTGPKKRAVVFLAAAAAVFAALLPLGLLMMDAENSQTVAARSVEPGGGDILLVRAGWQILLQPDGRSELLGLEEYLAGELAAMESGSGVEGYYDGYGYASGIYDGMLFDAAGKAESDWEWGIGLHPDSGKYYIELYNPDTGERLVGETETGSRKNEVHDARVSPAGDRIWVALNPGVPVNKTEVLEYSYPSMELTRSIIHDECMREGEIILSPEGEPLLAGIFDTGESGTDQRYGFLRMLDKGDTYAGEYLEVRYGDVMEEMNAEGIFAHTMDWFSDAVDASPYLLLSGEDNLKHLVYVLDTRDGRLYEVAEGTPVGWR